MNYDEEKTHEDLFSPSDSDAIVAAIGRAEKNTSGQIRVHIEDRCEGIPMERAAEVFEQLEMDETELRNGVLIYLAVVDHRVVVFGDDGINEKVPQGFWDDVVAKLVADFKKHNYLHGVVLAVEMVGEKLAQFYPLQGSAQNELSDEVSFG